MKGKSSTTKSTASSSTDQHQNGPEEVQVEREDDDEEEVVVPEVLVTGSPGQKSAQEGRVVVVQEGSDDNICGIYALVSDVSFTHCFNSVNVGYDFLFKKKFSTFNGNMKFLCFSGWVRQLWKVKKQRKKVTKPICWFEIQIRQTEEAGIQEGEKRLDLSMHISMTKNLGKLFSTHMYTKTILIYNNKFLLCTCSQIWLETFSLYFVLHSYKWQSPYWSSAHICARTYWTARFTRFRRTRRAKWWGDGCRRTWWW